MAINAKRLSAEIKYVNEERRNGFQNAPKWPEELNHSPKRVHADTADEFKARCDAWDQSRRACIIEARNYDKRTSDGRATNLYMLSAYLKGRPHILTHYVQKCDWQGRYEKFERDFQWNAEQLETNGVFKEFQYTEEEIAAVAEEYKARAVIHSIFYGEQK